MTKLLTIKAITGDKPYILLALNNARGEVVGIVALPSADVVDEVISELQRAGALAWPVEDIALSTAELIEAIRRDSGLL